MKAGIYHREVFLPKEFLDYFDKRTIQLSHTDHSKRAAISDKNGLIQPPTHVTLFRERIIEIEVAVNKAPKVVVRQPYDANNDLILAVLVSGRIGKVKTMWLNNKNDLHKTLDKNRYVAKV
jgi:hypothetical protein